MKKLFVCVLSLVLALSVAACGGKNTETSAPTTREGDTSYDANGTAIIGSDPKTWGPAEEGENVQIPNPWQECTSLEEAGKLAGFSFTAPETVDGYPDRYIAAIEGDVAQVIFTNGDDSKLYFRKGVGTEDISGDYNTYETTKEQTVGDRTVTCKGNGDLVYTATWTDGTYTYAVMSDAGMTAEQLSAWVQGLA